MSSMEKHAIPLAAMERILKRAGAHRVSEESKVALRQVLEDIAILLADIGGLIFGTIPVLERALLVNGLIELESNELLVQFSGNNLFIPVLPFLPQVNFKSFFSFLSFEEIISQ